MKRTLRWSASLLILLWACGGGDQGPGTPTGPTPDFALSISPSTLTIVIGESGDLLVTVARSGGFTGAVSITVDGLPAGVRGNSLSIGEGQTSVAITLTATATSQPGVWALTVRGSAAAVGQKSTEATLVTRIVI